MSSFVPLNEVAPELALKYLQTQMSREIAHWKYFDAEFNRGRNRGWVWLRENEVCGFVGQIPFQIARGDEILDAHWICDWSIADPQGNAGAGARLFKRAIANCALPMVVGGNSISIPLLDRMAARTDFEATSEYRRFLRLEPIIQALANKIPPLKLLRPLGKLPVARLSQEKVWISNGIAENIAPLLPLASKVWTAVYDVEFLRWQIERCPQLQAITVCDREENPHIAIVAWTHSGHSNWRFCLWQKPDCATSTSRQVLAGALSHIMQRGATQVSCVLSRWDEAQISLLKSAGFAPTKLQRPLFFYDNVLSELQLTQLQQVNFLAADLGHRF